MAKAVTISGEATKACVLASTVVTFGKVAVEGSNDGVLAVGIVDMTRPLTDTGAAGVGQYDTANRLECLEEAILFNGIADLFGSGCDGELGLCLQVFVDGLFSQ